MGEAPGERPNWGGRFAGLALFGGLAGWCVVSAGLIAMLKGAYGIIGPVSVDQAIAEFLRQGMLLGAFLLGTPVGAVVGLVIGLGWRLACHAGKSRSDQRPLTER